MRVTNNRLEVVEGDILGDITISLSATDIDEMEGFTRECLQALLDDSPELVQHGIKGLRVERWKIVGGCFARHTTLSPEELEYIAPDEEPDDFDLAYDSWVDDGMQD